MTLTSENERATEVDRREIDGDEKLDPLLYCASILLGVRDHMYS